MRSSRTVARELQRKHPSIFGKGAPGMPTSGLSKAAVRNVILRTAKDGASDGRGRPPALPAALVVKIMAALTAVVSARTTVMSAPMLQPIAIGVIIASGFGSLLHEGRRKRGNFCCGLHFVRGLMKDAKWRCVRPQALHKKGNRGTSPSLKVGGKLWPNPIYFKGREPVYKEIP